MAKTGRASVDLSMLTWKHWTVMACTLAPIILLVARPWNMSGITSMVSVPGTLQLCAPSRERVAQWV